MSATLAFQIQAQQQSEWCWAAVTSSIDHYFDNGSTWTQCGLANDQLGQGTCCNDGSSTSCNCPWYLERSLGRVNRLRAFLQAVAPFPGVQQEINQKDPLGVRIGWAGGGGHFVVIFGYDDATATDYVIVADPIWGVTQLPYSALVSGYRGNGSWTHSYYTQ